MDDLKNRLGLDAQSQKVDWGTLGVLGSESLAKLKYVTPNPIPSTLIASSYHPTPNYACMHALMQLCIYAFNLVRIQLCMRTCLLVYVRLLKLNNTA